MNFTYRIEYQNTQTQTVTVVYTPEDPKALPLVLNIPYLSIDSDSALHAKIISAAPIGTWENAIARSDVEFTLGSFAASQNDVLSANALLNPPLTFTQLQTKKLSWVDSVRLQAEASGFVFEFPNATNDVVQVRNERDKGNITGLVSSALILKSQGIVEPILAFRAESNTTYNLTPDQILSLGLATSSFISTLYEKAWLLKEAIHAATTTEELDGIIWV